MRRQRADSRAPGGRYARKERLTRIFQGKEIDRLSLKLRGFHPGQLPEPERLVSLVKDCAAAGAPSGRFILCLSAGFMEYPFPEPDYIRNLLLCLGRGYAEALRYRY
jgi:hypothetical protein